MSEESMASHLKVEPVERELTSAGSLAIIECHVNGVYGNDLMSFQELGMYMIPSPNSSPKLKTKQNAQTSPLQVQPLKQIRPSDCNHVYETCTGKLFCDFCQVRCLNAFNFKLHLEGQKHRDKLEELKLSENNGDNAAIREWCKVCRIEFLCRDMYMQHLKSQQHKDRIQEIKFRRKQGIKGGSEERNWCYLCKISCQNDYNFKLHLEGKKHALQLQDLEKGKAASKEEASMKHDHHDSDRRMNSERIDQRHWCDMCKVLFTAEHNLKQHLGGKRHARQLNATVEVKRAKKEVPATKLDKRDSELSEQQNWCKLCNVRCSTAYNLNSHLSGKKHALQLQILERIGVQTKIDVAEMLETKDYVGVAGM